MDFSSGSLWGPPATAATGQTQPPAAPTVGPACVLPPAPLAAQPAGPAPAGSGLPPPYAGAAGAAPAPAAAAAAAAAAPAAAVAPPSPPNASAADAPEPRNLIVNYIPTPVTDAELRQLFEQYGELESARVIVDRVSLHPKGYGFVKFKREECARDAMEKMNGFEIHNKRLKVTAARGPASAAINTHVQRLHEVQAQMSQPTPQQPQQGPPLQQWSQEMQQVAWQPQPQQQQLQQQQLQQPYNQQHHAQQQMHLQYGQQQQQQQQQQLQQQYAQQQQQQQQHQQHLMQQQHHAQHQQQPQPQQQQPGSMLSIPQYVVVDANMNPVAFQTPGGTVSMTGAGPAGPPPYGAAPSGMMPQPQGLPIFAPFRAMSPGTDPMFRDSCTFSLTSSHGASFTHSMELPPPQQQFGGGFQ